MTFRRVLIAVDSGHVAAHAAKIGAALAHEVGAELALLHAVVVPPLTYASGEPTSTERMVADAIQEAEGLLGSVHQCLALPASTVDFIDVGRPAAVIVEAAKRWSADLIVMGSHGRGGVERMLFGSVAEGVIRHAPCAVLIVPV